MANQPTAGELFRAGRLTDDDVNSSVLAYLTAPKPGPRLIAKGVTLDIGAAVAVREWATRIVDEGVSEAALRSGRPSCWRGHRKISSRAIHSYDPTADRTELGKEWPIRRDHPVNCPRSYTVPWSATPLRLIAQLRANGLKKADSPPQPSLRLRRERLIPSPTRSSAPFSQRSI